MKAVTKAVTYYKGLPVEIMGKPIHAVSLPDWNLQYIQRRNLPVQRDALRKAAVRIVKVTTDRIYFEDR